MMELSHITTNQLKILSILYFEPFDKLTDGIVNHFQQPNFLVYKNIQHVFVKSYNWSNYDYSMSLVGDMGKTNSKSRDLKVKLGQFYTNVDL